MDNMQPSHFARRMRQEEVRNRVDGRFRLWAMAQRAADGPAVALNASQMYIGPANIF